MCSDGRPFNLRRCASMKAFSIFEAKSFELKSGNVGKFDSNLSLIEE